MAEIKKAPAKGLELLITQSKDSKKHLSKEVIKKLRLLHREKKPGVNVPRYEDHSANGLTRCIIDYIILKGFQAERINCFGRPIPNGDGSYRMGETTMDKGTADISATIKGRSVKIEVKAGNDKLSTFQWQYKASIEGCGGLYIIAKSFAGFLLDLHKKIKL